MPDTMTVAAPKSKKHKDKLTADEAAKLEKVDAGIEAPADAAPIVTSGIATKMATFSFAPIDPNLTLDQRKVRVRELLHQATDAEGKLEIMQGELLYEANKNGYWKTWDFVDEQTGVTRPYSSWDEMVEKEVGLKRRKAFYLIDLYDTYVVRLQLPEETLKTLEWSKAALVTKIVTAENWPLVLKTIGSMGWAKVNEFVKEVKESKDVEQAIATVTAPKALPSAGDGTIAVPTGGKKSEAGEDFKTFSVKLSVSQYENVGLALSVAKKVMATESNAHALDIIAAEYLASTRSDMSKADIVASIVKGLEDNYGVIVHVDHVPEDMAGDGTAE